MQNTAENNKRIAKNTLVLYMRMVVMMFIGLYTSRVNLQALGVTDYGIYNVVGGVVAMFGLISGSLTASISRFITFELGRGDKQQLAKVFSASVTIQIMLALIIAVLVEIIGVWFLNTKMVIPPERLTAANWVLQFSVVTFALGLISAPYNACIVAHERMSAFAYMTLVNAGIKLLVAFLVSHATCDRLIFFAALLCSIAVLMRIIYGAYCVRHFEECRYHFHWDGQLLKQMFAFAGWNTIGASSALLTNQGGNMCINLFFGPAVNAAKGIAGQVNGAITGFASNFMTAVNPQITKCYASGDHEYMISLIFRSARMSFYLLLLLGLPVMISTHFVLSLWLGMVPDHTVSFIRLTLIHTMSSSLSNPLITAQLATGKIRNYQIVVGGCQMLNLPIFYVWLRLGGIPEVVLIVEILISQCCLGLRLYMLRNMIHLHARQYLKKVYLNVIVVSIISAFIPLCLSLCIEESLWTFIGLTLICLACTALAVLFIGCSPHERDMIRTYAIKMKGKLLHRGAC